MNEIPKFSSFKGRQEKQGELYKKEGTEELIDKLKRRGLSFEEVEVEKKGNDKIDYKEKKREKKKWFIIDLLGDINNIKYGKNDKYSIPYYERSGKGRVIGCKENIRMRVDPENPNEIILYPLLNYNNYKKKVNFEFNEDLECVEESKGLKDINEVNYQENYIAFEIDDTNTSCITNDTSIISEKIENDDNVLHIWKKGDPQLELKELSKKVEESPLDYKSWLKLADIQDKILWTNNNKKSKAEQLAINEVKLKILEKALSHCPDNDDLVLKYMSIIILIWEPQKINLEWSKILKRSLSLPLWKKYMDFYQTNSISFSYSECLENFKNNLEILKEASKNEKCQKKIENIEEIIQYVLIRIWFYMKEAGYIENSIASVQALIEFNFFMPDSFLCNVNNASCLQDFEEFWDSEVPRFGEDEAKGWKKYDNKYQHIISFDKNSNDISLSNNENISQDIEDEYTKWYKQETAKNVYVNPKRSTNTDTDNDPYSIIFFSDIEQLLYFFTSNRIRLNLIYFSLHFFGFSLHRIDKTSNESPLLDSFIQDFSSIDSFNWFWSSEYLSLKLSQQFNKNTIDSDYLLKHFQSPVHIKLKNWPITIDTLFSIDNTWYQNINYQGFNKDFIKNCFEQLKDIIDDDLFSMLHLLFWNYYSSSDVRKLAKFILKKKPLNMKLWCAYAQLEYLNGNILEARKIFVNTLKNIKPDHTEKSYDYIVAYKLWAEIEMKNNEIDNSIKILVSMVESELNIKTLIFNNEKIHSDSILLKAQKSFQHLNRLSLSFGNYKMLRLFTECHALLNYLIKSLDIALEVYSQTKNDFNNSINSNSIEYEQLLTSELQLLYYCSQTTKVFKISTIQDRARSALSKFPNNCIFLSIFIWSEAKSLLKTKIYHYFEKNIFKAVQSSYIVFLSAIWSELYINPYNINTHAIRSLFERAVENQETKSDLIIWKLYIQFEIQHGTLEKGKAIFYRAIRDCPWSKNLILIAFNELRSQFNSEELTKLYNTMIEREFRISIDLEIAKNIQETSYSRLAQLPQDISSDEAME
ncbi:hypothetical protein T552_00155 [Pneumocystis carinii B80]|uniref:Suppressor of forked domain-containing protein n=1 Tax=Pneumocystis carinii (strain B80) TaxID=1408658 RepID=A0A0W4ZT04_PNEC8|nr:hypothetical protein T552_00155 [Pneumocystis carinii B80]KTW31513.1 hypothetical protein T552_00155 [Pneumocystis carinii B80]